MIPLRINLALPDIKGKRIALLGSAPVNHGIPKGCDMVASINGSHKAFGLSHVDILFLNSWSLQSRNNPAQIAVQDALESTTCDTLIFIDAARVRIVPTLGQTTTASFSNEDRRDLLTWATGVDYTDAPGGETVPSTGITAALVLRKLGAIPILSGFSLGEGHALTTGSRRWHTDQDAKFISLFDDMKKVEA